MSGPALADRPELVRALAAVKASAAEANATAGVLDPDAAAAVVAAADALAGDPSGAVGVPLLHGGGGIVVHRAVNGLLGDGAGASQSTADVLHTAARVAVLERAGELLAAVDRAGAALVAAGRRWVADAPETLARTCLRDGIAVPTDLLPAGGAAALGRAADRVGRALEPLHDVVLGSTVVGTGAGAPGAYRDAVVVRLAARTGLPLRPSPQAASALQHGDDLLAVAAALAGLARVLARVAGDLRLLSSGPAGGLGELRQDPTGDGSTFFAGKTNPVDAETVVVLAASVVGAHAAAEALAGRAELHLDVYDLPVAVHVLLALDAAGEACEALARFAAVLDVEPERCASLAAAAHPIGRAHR